MKRRRPLYLFFHIEKTAGSTFRYHIVKNLEENERLLFSLKTVGLRGRENELSYEMFLTASGNYINSLDDERKKKIMILYGNLIPFGVHNFFEDREFRYITFVRDPLERIVSTYNHRRGIIEENPKSSKEKKNAIKYLSVNGNIPSFKVWLKDKYEQQYYFDSMYKTLKYFGYIEEKGSTRDSIIQALNKFYFIGTMKTFEEDSLYLYHMLGFRSYFTNQNVSKKYFKLNDKRVKLEKILHKKNKKSYDLYDLATERRNIIVKNMINFENIVQSEKLRKKFFLPFTQLLFAPSDSLKMLGKVILRRLGVNARFLV